MKKIYISEKQLKSRKSTKRKPKTTKQDRDDFRAIVLHPSLFNMLDPRRSA